MRLFCQLICIFLSVSFVVCAAIDNPFMAAQVPPPTTGATTPDIEKNPPPPTPSPSPKPLYTTTHHSKVLGDYVPCLFEESQESSFRSVEAQEPVVSQAQGDNIKTAFDSKQYGTGLVGVTPLDIVGKSFSDALQELLTVIGKADATNSNQVAATAYVKNMLSAYQADWPDDVSCSFSFLRWQETSDVFGRRVANEYVALQVNIRNLNPNSEFLIHDIQVAVDSMAPVNYMTHHFARFQTSRDKLVVRAVAQRGQTEDRRNLILNTLTMVGAIGGGVNAALQAADAGTSLATNYSTGVAIFQGSFLPGFANIFPDHTLEHINHINDMTFSASSTSKTVVPIQGSVPLITFISEKPLEQMPFAACGKDLHPADYNHPSKTTSTQTLPTQSNIPGNAGYPACEENPTSPGTLAYPKPVGYKHWPAAALSLLESRTYVVIGGVHINETSTNASLTKLECPAFSDGTIDLSKISNSAFICSVTGAHLEKAANVTLKPTGASTAKSINGALTASADGTGGTVQFAASDLNTATGQFAVLLTDSAGNSSTTTLMVNFPSPIREPHITVAPVFTGSHTTDSTLVLTGTNLDRAATFTLTSAAGTTSSLAIGTISITSTSVEQVNSSLSIKIPANSVAAGTYTLSGTGLDGQAASFVEGTSSVVVP